LTRALGDSITNSMKVAVSIPDPVFAQGEALAKRMKLSRSKLYAKALDAFVADNNNVALTAQINAALEGIEEDETDLFVKAAARQTLQNTEW
jgi:metal-responsive CopG/Arc/MetJ family transcriptional regulator